jgi:hypothetical protein
MDVRGHGSIEFHIKIVEKVMKNCQHESPDVSYA